MPSPRGEYTPKQGPLAGQPFTTYFQYQQARSRAMGFANYSEERRTTQNAYFRTLENRFMSVHQVSRTEARTNVQAEVRLWPASFQRARSGNVAIGNSEEASDLQRYRKNLAIRWAMDNGLYDSGDEASGEIDY